MHSSLGVSMEKPKCDNVQYQDAAGAELLTILYRPCWEETEDMFTVCSILYLFV